MLDIEETVAAFRRLKILVIGDVMLDCYLSGKINRISPEAPVPIIDLSSKENRPGGAANVALNIHALGAKPFLFSTIGNDLSGKTLLNLLPENGINTKYIKVLPDRRTTTKTRVLAQNQQIIRLDEEDVFDLETEHQKLMLNDIRNLLDQMEIDAILFQDYNKGLLTDFMIREVLLEALKRDIPTAVDPKCLHFFSYKRATLFKPNLKEIKAKLPFLCEANLPDLTKATQYLKNQINNTLTLITLSENGVFYSDQENIAILPTTPRKIADVCGAGDSVISIATLGLALKLPIAEIAQLANLAGGQVCERVGVVPVSLNQLITDYLKLGKI